MYLEIFENEMFCLWNDTENMYHWESVNINQEVYVNKNHHEF